MRVAETRTGSSTRCRVRSRCQLPDDDRDEQDGPLYLVVTIKPRLDRLAEAEAQLQSMRKNTLTEPGVCSCISYSLRMIRTRG